MGSQCIYGIFFRVIEKKHLLFELRIVKLEFEGLIRGTAIKGLKKETTFEND